MASVCVSTCQFLKGDGRSTPRGGKAPARSALAWIWGAESPTAQPTGISASLLEKRPAAEFPYPEIGARGPSLPNLPYGRAPSSSPQGLDHKGSHTSLQGRFEITSFATRPNDSTRKCLAPSGADPAGIVARSDVAFSGCLLPGVFGQGNEDTQRTDWFSHSLYLRYGRLRKQFQQGAIRATCASRGSGHRGVRYRNGQV